MSKKNKQNNKPNTNKQPTSNSVEITKPAKEINYAGRDLKALMVFLMILGEISWFIAFCVNVVIKAI